MHMVEPPKRDSPQVTRRIHHHDSVVKVQHQGDKKPGVVFHRLAMFPNRSPAHIALSSLNLVVASTSSRVRRSQHSREYTTDLTFCQTVFDNYFNCYVYT